MVSLKKKNLKIYPKQTDYKSFLTIFRKMLPFLKIKEVIMKKNIMLSLAGIITLSLMGNSVYAEDNLYNQVNLSANGETSIEQDFLTINLSYETDGSNNKQVQENLTKKLNDSISDIKNQIKNHDFTVKMGRFSVYPQYNKSTVSGWHGVATIIMEGKDFPAISNAASSVKDFTIQSTSFSVSPEKISQLKDKTVTKAIEKFKEQAQKVSKDFGFNQYKIKAVNVSYDEQGAMPVFRTMMNAQAPMAVSAKESTPVDFEAGKTTIRASVDGSIVMYGNNEAIQE